MKRIVLSIVFLSFFGISNAQYADEYKSGMVVKLNEDGSKQMRVLLWGQTWFQDFEGNNPNDGFSVKRARALMYSKLNDRFMILTHFGVNGVNDNNLTPTGKSDDVQFFLHEMVLQYKINNYLNIGAGIHNWGGISRLNGQGTINMMTLDNNRASWTTLGLSDQFSNHLGVYFSGTVDRLNYRLSISDALTNTLDGNSATILQPGQEKYLGKALLAKGKYAIAGYFDYQFLEKENLALPYRVGTYLGGKKVFNVGAGFFTQPDAIVQMDPTGMLSTTGATHLNSDVFYDTPIGQSSSITAYAQFQNSKMGDNYINGDIVGNGNQFYAHVGYLIAKNNIQDGKDKYKNRWQPYLAYSNRNFTALPEAAKELKIGGNFYVDGHNAKISFEYQKSFHLPSQRDDMFTIQAMILL